MTTKDQRRQYEQLALQDHARHVGKVVMVRELTAYPGTSDDSQDFVFDPPLAVRVLPSSSKEVIHWVDEWLDPYWDVEIVDTAHPNLPDGLEHPWMFGISYNTEDGKFDGDGFHVETWKEWRSRLWKSTCRWLNLKRL